MQEDLENLYMNHSEPNRGCLLALRDIILNQDNQVHETIKYGMPCFCYKHKMFCYLWTDKKTMEPYILFVEGKHLEHACLESGNRSRMKILRVNAHADIPIDIIQEVLSQAIS